MGTGIINSLSKIFRNLYQYFITSYCLKCGIERDSSNGLCGHCFGQIIFLNEPYCEICGEMFPFQFDNKSLCGNCIKAKPQYDKARYIFSYDEISKHLIFKIKYQGDVVMAKFFADQLYVKYKIIINDADIICPVPLHFFKLLMRGFNQSAILSKYLSKESGVIYIKDILIKHKYTKTQASLTQKQRLFNIRGSIKINNKYLEMIKNRNIILIDDVVTTGSTINECAKVLKKSGAKSVIILAIAKTNKNIFFKKAS